MSKRWVERPLKWLIAAGTLLVLPAQGAGMGAGIGASNVIDRAVAALGGERLETLTSVVTEWRIDDALIFQSRRSAPPWDRTQRWEGFAIDFVGRRYADARYDGGSGYEWITGTICDSRGAMRLDYRNRTYRLITQEFDDAIADAMLLSPLVLLRWLSEHRGAAEHIGHRQVDDSTFEVLEVSRNDGSTVEVTFDAESRLIHGLEWAYTDYDGTRIPLRFRYLDWRNTQGLKHPARVEVHAHGAVARRASLAHVDFGSPIDRYLNPPDGFRETASEPADIRAFRFEEIADGVYFVGEGVMYQLIVEFDDFLVALDASSGDVQRRIDAVRESIPDKRFRYVLASHHHDDHLHGLDEFVALGATILAAPAHKDVVSRYVEEQLGRRPELIQVLDEHIVADSTRKLHITEIGPTLHSEHMLVAHLPAEKILFAADLYVLGGRREPVKPAMANGHALYEQIKRRDLDVELIVDPHSPLIATVSDLELSVKAARAEPEGLKARALASLSAWRSAGETLDDKDEGR